MEPKVAAKHKLDKDGDEQDLFWGAQHPSTGVVSPVPLPSTATVSGDRTNKVQGNSQKPKSRHHSQSTARPAATSVGKKALLSGGALAAGAAMLPSATSPPRPIASWVSPTIGVGGQGAFSLLDFAPMAKTSRNNKSKHKRLAQNDSKYESEALESEALEMWGRCASVTAASASAPLPSLATIQAEEERSVDPAKLRRVKIHNKAEQAWRNNDVGGTPLSVAEIQRREQWEAEEREALSLIQAVYGDAALLPDSHAAAFSL